MFWRLTTFIGLLLFAYSEAACAAPGMIQAEGSLPIQASANHSYELHNLLDGEAGTAWCTRAHRTGSAWFGLLANDKRTWEGFGIINGYARDEKSFKKNARVKTLAIYLDGKLLREIEMKDSPRPQWVSFSAQNARELKLEVREVYAGEHDDDLCVSELIKDERVVNVWYALDGISKKAGRRSLSPKEISDLYKPLLHDIDVNRPVDQSHFVRGVALYVNGKGEVELRMLLDMLYQADLAKNLNVELMDELTARLIPYFESNPQAVINVLNDRTQVKRDSLADAYYTFIDPFGGEQGLEIYTRKHPAFRRISVLVEALGKQEGKDAR